MTTENENFMIKAETNVANIMEPTTGSPLVTLRSPEGR